MGGPDAVVVGAGVIGLTSAVLLAEVGSRGRVLDGRSSAETTSRVAGALWAASPLQDPDGALARRAGVSLEVFGQLAGEPSSGVRIAHGTVASRERPAPRCRCSRACGCGLRSAGRLRGGIRARRAADRDGALPGVPAAAPARCAVPRSWHGACARCPSPPGTHRWSSTAAASEPASWRGTPRSHRFADSTWWSRTRAWRISSWRTAGRPSGPAGFPTASGSCWGASRSPARKIPCPDADRLEGHPRTLCRARAAAGARSRT